MGIKIRWCDLYVDVAQMNENEGIIIGNQAIIDDE